MEQGLTLWNAQTWEASAISYICGIFKQLDLILLNIKTLKERKSTSFVHLVEYSLDIHFCVKHPKSAASYRHKASLKLRADTTDHDCVYRVQFNSSYLSLQHLLIF